MSSTIQRAYELAKSGSYRSIQEIERQLNREQHEGVHSHLQSPTLRKQIKGMLKQKAFEG